MRTYRRLALGMALAAAMPALALAQGGPGPGQSYVELIYPNGKIMMVPIFGKKDLDMMMEHAKPMGGPVMIMMSGGKAYMLEDMKMSTGRSLSEYLSDPAYRGGA
jgi:hypothetical protein